MPLSLDSQENISTINPMAMSDIQILEEFKKYRNAYKGKVTFSLISKDMGRTDTYINVLHYQVTKTHRSLHQDTRDFLIHYLVKKGWLTPAGLPKDLGPVMGALPTPIFRKVEMPTTSIPTYYGDLSDKELIAHLTKFKVENNYSYKELSSKSQMHHDTLRDIFNGGTIFLREKSRKRIFNMLSQANWFAEQQEVSKIMGSTIGRALEQIQEGRNAEIVAGSTIGRVPNNISDRALKLKLKDYKMKSNIPWRSIAESLQINRTYPSQFIKELDTRIEAPLRKRIIIFLNSKARALVPIPEEVKVITESKQELSPSSSYIKASIIAGIFYVPGLTKEEREQALMQLPFTI